MRARFFAKKSKKKRVFSYTPDKKEKIPAGFNACRGIQDRFLRGTRYDPVRYFSGVGCSKKAERSVLLTT